MIRIGIRADGNSNTGMGHLMRCLSLAHGFRTVGCRVFFLTKFNETIDKVLSEGFDAIRLSGGKEPPGEGFYYGDISELPGEAAEIIDAVKQNDISVLFIDSYNVTEEYFLKVRPHVKKLGYIDDINEFRYPVDILVNGNITGPCMGYEGYDDGTLMLLGLEYNLVRPEFRRLPVRIVNREIKELMITTGGSDPCNMSVTIAGMLLKCEALKNVKINIVVGAGFANIEELRRLSEENPGIVLHRNVQRIWEIMLKSDIAISAGGSTLYELCACGTPALAFVMAANQEFIVEKMSELGYIETLGWYNSFSGEELIARLERLAADYEARFALTEKMQRLVDGNGAWRIAGKVVELMTGYRLELVTG